MRIIGGSARGQKMFAPDTKDTRPMPDRVRESLFNILGDIEGLSLLDAYAGSGAVGLEALSRGASRAAAIESGSSAVAAIERNLEKLGFRSQHTLYKTTIELWTAHNKDKFDIVVAGPPFTDFRIEPLTQLVDAVAKGGTFVLQHPKRMSPPEFSGFQLVKSRRYGINTLSFYK